LYKQQQLIHHDDLIM